jgi:hypothetical protein
MAGHMRVDDSHWPVVISTHDGPQSDQDVDEFMRRIDSIHARHEPFVIMTIIKSFDSNLAHVKRLAAWGNARSSVHKQTCKGVALVLASSSGRFIVSSFFLIFMPAFPFVSFDNVPSAIGWLRRRLLEAGLTVPASLASLEGSQRPRAIAR